MESYEEFFVKRSEEELVAAVRAGMDIYEERPYYDDGGWTLTFFEAAIRLGSHKLVTLCLEKGANASWIKYDKQLCRQDRSTLDAALEACNPGALRALIEAGADLETLRTRHGNGGSDGKLWDLRRDLLPEAGHSEDFTQAEQRELRDMRKHLDDGAEILHVLKDYGFSIPGMEPDNADMSFYGIDDYSRDWDELEAEGFQANKQKSDEGYDLYSEGRGQQFAGEIEYIFPRHGTRPNALWHAVSPEALKLMLRDKPNLEARDITGWTAMHHIAYHCVSKYHLLRCSGYYFRPNDMLQLLIDAGADVNARGRYGMTPLMLTASLAVHYPAALHTVKLLLRNGADPNLEDEDGNAVLFWLLEFSSGRISGKIREDLFNEIISETNRLSDADLDLLLSSLADGKDELERALRRGADINAQTQRGYTALSLASMYNTKEVIEFLESWGAALENRNDLGETALMQAYDNDNESAIIALLEHGANIRAVDFKGRTILMRVMGHRSLSPNKIRELILNGLDVNARDNNGCTPLMYAVRSSNFDKVQTLLEMGADVNVKDRAGRSALGIMLDERGFDSAKPEIQKIIPLLLEAGASVEPLRTPVPVKMEHSALYDELEKHGLIPCESFEETFERNDGASLAAALRNGFNVFVRDKTESKHYNNVIGARFQEFPLNFFFASLRYGTRDIIQACLEAGAQVNALWGGEKYGSYDYTFTFPLYQAIDGHNPEAVQTLIEAGCDLSRGIENFSCANLCANVFPEGEGSRDGEAKAMKRWLDKGSKILHMLHDAGCAFPDHDPGNRELSYLKKEISSGAEHIRWLWTWYKSKEDWAKLFLAVSAEALKPLLSHIDPDTRDPWGWTPLLYIVDDINGYFHPEDMVRVLLEAGADPEVCDNDGWTPLMRILIQARSIKTIQIFRIISMLLAAGADLDAQNTRGSSARSFFVDHYDVSESDKRFRGELLNTLECAFSPKKRVEQEKVALDIRPQDARLFIAAYCGTVEDVRNALSDGANVECRTPKLLYTPLMLAAFYNTPDVVRCLIDEGRADLEAKVKGGTALCFAILSEREDASVVREFIAAGSNINVLITWDLTPLLLPSYSPKTPEKALALIAAGANVSERHGGRDPLTSAVEAGRFKIVKALLTAGADPRLLLKISRTKE